MSKEDTTGPAGLGEIVRRLSDLFDHLADLKDGELPRRGHREKDGVVFEYSFSKRTADQGRGADPGRARSEGPRAEGPRPRSQARQSEPSRAARPSPGAPVEPVTDMFDEADEVLLLFELPGAAKKDVRCVLDGDILLVEATAGERLYRKEMLIEQPLEPGEPHITLRNGVLQVRLKKRRAK